jgi:hypothetical protein
MISRCFLSFLVLLFVCAPASAQTDSTRFDRLWLADYDGPRRLEVGVSAGYALSSDWTDLVALHVFDTRGGIHRQVLLRNVAVAPGAGGAAAVTYWRGRHAFRATVGYSKSCLTTTSRCVAGPTSPPESGAALGVAEVSMDVYRYGIEGIVGLRNWEDSQFWRPYLIVGAGGVTYDPDEDALPLFPGTFETIVQPPSSGAGTVVISNGATTLLVATDELGLENVFGLTLGVGMDFRVPVGIGGLALRLEVADQITSSPFSVTVSRLDDDDRDYFDRGNEPTVFRAGAIHNLRLTAGVAVELPLRGPRTETDPWDKTRRR